MVCLWFILACEAATGAAQEPMLRPPVVAQRIRTPQPIMLQVQAVPFAEDAPIADPGRVAEFKLSARSPYLENHGYLTITGFVSPSENRITLVGEDRHLFSVNIFVDGGRQYLLEIHADSRYPPSTYHVRTGEQGQSLMVEARPGEPALFGFRPASSGVATVWIQPVGESILDFRGDITIRRIDR